MPASRTSAPIPASAAEAAPVFGSIGSGWVPCSEPDGAPKTEPEVPRVDPKPPKLGPACVPGVELVPKGAVREGEPNDGSKGGRCPAGMASGEKLYAVIGLGAGPTYGGAAGGGRRNGGRAAAAPAAGMGAEALGAAAAREEAAAVCAETAREEAATVGATGISGGTGGTGGTGGNVASICHAT